jgi:hypothetical protein
MVAPEPEDGVDAGEEAPVRAALQAQRKTTAIRGRNRIMKL